MIVRNDARPEVEAKEYKDCQSFYFSICPEVVGRVVFGLFSGVALVLKEVHNVNLGSNLSR